MFYQEEGIVPGRIKANLRIERFVSRFAFLVGWSGALRFGDICSFWCFVVVAVALEGIVGFLLALSAI